MKTWLLSLLILGVAAGNATAQLKVTVSQPKDGYVNISLPWPPPGGEYHNVSLSSRHQSTLSPLQINPNTWVVPESWDIGVISGVLCTDESCTPFKSEWFIPGEKNQVVGLVLFGIAVFIGVLAIVEALMGWRMRIWDS